MTDKTRQGDLEYLSKVIKNPMKSSGERREAKISMHKIVNESGKVRSMREKLVKEMRAGNTDNVRDISEWVRKHGEYQ